MRVIIHFECTTCKDRSYSSTKNKTKTPARLEKKKFCKKCRKHTVHRETK